MKRLLLLAALAIPATGHGEVRHSVDYHPNPSFVSDVRRPQAVSSTPVAQLGQVAILEGDETLVSISSAMGLGLSEANLHAITQRFYATWGDDFDEIVVFTTFDDNAAQGALAYEISTRQNIKNIGRELFDDSAMWGASGHLLAFVNMMRWDQFETVDIPSTDPRSELFSTLGQEFAHAWVAFLQYQNAQGQPSSSMLGRDLAHWSSTLQADASVIDGNRIVDNGDGTFTIAETMARYSPLDQYAMGLIPASAVPPFFIVNGATTASGTAIAGADLIPVGATFKGTRENITIDQVVAATGPRMPSDAQSPHGFRVAFVLLTSPVQRAADVLDAARTLDQVRKTWETVFSDYTAGHGTMCTQIAAPCGAPLASIVDGSIREKGGNGNGVVEPGEPIEVTFTLANSGTSDATGVAVTAAGDAITAPQQAMASVPAAGQTTVTFSGVVPKDAACGQPVVVTSQAALGATTTSGLAAVVAGSTDALVQDFESGDGGFMVGPGSPANGWEWGTPVEYKRASSGFVYQPGVGNGGSSKVWFTGLAEGHRAMGDSSLGVGTSTLLSPTIDLAKTYQPTLRYAAWFQAIDYTNVNMPQTPTDVALTVDVTADGGKSWSSIDRVDVSDERWQPRSVALASHVPADAKIQVRFSVSNPQSAYQVEAGIDDFAIGTLTTACNPSHGSGGCSCELGRRGAPFGATPSLIAAVALALMLGARRVRKQG